MSATHSYLVPWGDDDLEVLRMKWHIANERAMECEKLKSELNRIGETYGRKAHNSLDINPLICGSIVKCAELAVSNLYPTGLLKSDFEYFVTGDSERESEKIELIKQEINRVPECPSSLWKNFSPSNKVLITLVLGKRWQKLLPFMIELANSLSRLARRFADALQESLKDRAADSQQSPAPLVTDDNLEDFYDQRLGKPFKIWGVEISLSRQRHIILLYLFDNKDEYKTAPDIALIVKAWKDLEKPEKCVSEAISKLEKDLGDQLQFAYEGGQKNKSNRPIQRHNSGHRRTVRYRLNPDLFKPTGRKK